MEFREATLADVEHIVELLADDKLGAKREDYKKPLPKVYLNAFNQIEKDPNQKLIVVDIDGEIAGTAQLTFIPYLTYQGGTRAQIEAVRIKSKHRGTGLGEKLISWLVDLAKAHGAHLIQLTTDKERPEALRFYQKLGFKASHEGMKLHF